MAGAAVAAWPDPATLLPVAAMNFVVLTLVAFWFGIPAAHLPAGLALAAIWLVSIYVWRGDIGWTLAGYEPLSRALVSAMSGRMLVPLVGVLGLVAGLLRKRGGAKMPRCMGFGRGGDGGGELGAGGVVWLCAGWRSAGYRVDARHLCDCGAGGGLDCRSAGRGVDWAGAGAGDDLAGGGASLAGGGRAGSSAGDGAVGACIVDGDRARRRCLVSSRAGASGRGAAIVGGDFCRCSPRDWLLVGAACTWRPVRWRCIWRGSRRCGWGWRL